jgi:hypothetical protein
MKKLLILTLSLGIGPVLSFGSIINLGTIATNHIAVLGYDAAAFSGSVLVNVLDTSHFNVTGDVVGSSVGSGINFVSGSAVTSGAEFNNAKTDFASVISQLTALAYTPLSITSGAVNTFSTPGNYLLSTGVLGAGTVINITTAGQYNFKVAGNLTLSGGVIINGKSSSLSSDDVFWFVPTGVVSITNSTVFGDVVQAGASNDLLQDSAGLSGKLTGRFLSGGFFTTLQVSQNSTENIISQGFGVSTAPVPEPSTLAFLSIGLGLSAIAFLKRKVA